MQKTGESMRSCLQRWSTIKNSAENISDERAIYAFNHGLRHTNFVEEPGRPRPGTLGELMDLANKWANGEDVASNKWARSPKEDRVRRGNDRRRQTRNYDDYDQPAQVALDSQEKTIEEMTPRNIECRGSNRDEPSSSR
jgi:hypothetical protein